MPSCVSRLALRQRYHPSAKIEMFANKLSQENDRGNYGSGTHAAHTDHSYYANPAKISQDTVNFFIDNVKVIEDLHEEEDPEAFELLSTVPIRLARRRLTVHEECDPSEVPIYHIDIQLRRPVVYFDETHGHHKLIFNMKHEGFELNLVSGDNSPSRMQKYYKVYELLRSKLSDPKYHQTIVFKEGMAALYDNSRVSHGRGPLHPTTQRALLVSDVVSEIWYSRCRLMLGKKSGLEDKWLYGCSLKALELLADRYERGDSVFHFNGE